jgi:hypothetical protein
VWNDIPASHRTCNVDADCTLLTAAANCFHRAVNAAARPAYEAFLEAHGPGCTYGVSGMCPPDPERRAACREGSCAVMPDAQLRPG